MTPHLGAALAVLAAVAALAFAAALRWQRWRLAARSSRRARRGFAGQARAASLLARAGFAVQDAQPRVDWTTLQDGAPHVVELRADYLVTRRGRRYLAEVKTGEAADSLLDNSATRRQLLEYQLAFGVDGILLVCPERRAVHRIEFTALRPVRQAGWGLATVLLAAGAALGWIAESQLAAHPVHPTAAAPDCGHRAGAGAAPR